LKKAKIISIVIVMFFVIALGAFMGKQVFRLMEVGGTTTTDNNGEVAKSDYSGTSYEEVGELNSTSLNTHQKVPPVNQPNLSDDSTTSVANMGFQRETPNREPQPPIRPTRPEPVIARQEPKLITNEPVAPISRVEPVTQVNKVEEKTVPVGVKTYAFANGSGINVRTGPSIREAMLFKIGNGTKGLVLEKKNGWTRILWDFNKERGWVRDDLLNFSSTPVMPTPTAQAANKEINITPAKKVSPENIVAVAMAKPADISVTTNSYKSGDKLPTEAVINAETFANIRSLPTTSSEKIGKLPKGMVVRVKNVKKEGRWQWFEIVFQAGRKVGWTREDNLKFE
jgi:uncharacterized protein YgiM (DUF1202 family)